MIAVQVHNESAVLDLLQVRRFLTYGLFWEIFLTDWIDVSEVTVFGCGCSPTVNGWYTK